MVSLSIYEPGLGKKCRPRSGCPQTSSLIRVYNVCHFTCIVWTSNFMVYSLYSDFRIDHRKFWGILKLWNYMAILVSVDLNLPTDIFLHHLNLCIISPILRTVQILLSSNSAPSEERTLCIKLRILAFYHLKCKIMNFYA